MADVTRNVGNADFRLMPHRVADVGRLGPFRALSRLPAEANLERPGIVKGPAAPEASRERGSMLRLHGVHVAIAIVAFSALIALGIVGAYLVLDVPPKVLLRDPNALTYSPPYFGLISNFGVLLWAAAAVIPLWTYAGARSQPAAARRRPDILLFGGIFTIFLLIDDLFMVHESLPAIGLPENVYVVLYLGAMSLFLIAFTRPILESEWLLLLGSLAFFGLSVGIDLIADNLLADVGGRGYVEDMAKLVGILFWLAYFVSLSWTEQQACLRPARRDRSMSDPSVRPCADVPLSDLRERRQETARR